MNKKKLVVLTGAGISAESGLKTFRDSDGLWEGYDIEEVATPRAWKKNQKLVLDFYNVRRKNVLTAQPNVAHLKLAELQQYFDVKIITQNIDDLHERAGSLSVLHLHGEILKMRSEKNSGITQLIRSDMEYGATAPDGGLWRPDVVWFEEPVPRIAEAVPMVNQADIFLVVGTSLVVYPAAGLVDYVPHYVPKFIVDKKLPVVSSIKNLIVYENSATEGMGKLAEKLINEYI
jgi:NAD-dependent deacetylase